MFGNCGFLDGWFGVRAHHVVNAFQNDAHVVFAQVSISVYVVQLKNPLQFLFFGSPRQN